jgi:hypothetical protein
LDPIGEQPDCDQPEHEAADVREVGDPSTAAGRLRAEVARPEPDLYEDPDPEHEQGGQLDDREEDDDEHDRDHASARVEQGVGA